MQKILWINPLVFATVILFLATDCKKEDPESQTRPATNLSKTGATLNGTVDPNGLSTTVTFEYGATTSYDSSVTARQSPIPGNSITNVSADISGLTIGTTYHFRVKAENSHWTVYGSDMEFEYGYPPTVTTLAITNSESEGVTLNGNVSAGGFATIVTFEYGTTTGYGNELTAEQNPVTGNDITCVSADIPGLTQCTTYHFRVKAENSFGPVYGSDIEFDFMSPPVVALEVTNVTSNTIILNGTVNARGFPTVVTFEYGTTASYGQVITPEPNHVTGYINTNVSGTLTGITCGTVYHFRVKAENSCGTIYGSDIELFACTPPIVETLTATNFTSTTAKLYGAVYNNLSTANVTFEYGTTKGYGNEVTAEQNPVTGNDINDITVVSAIISGLRPCTIYHFRVKAENSCGTTYSSDATFHTIPNLTTTSISGITATTAFSGGYITGEGDCSPITDRGVEWWRICRFCPPPLTTTHHYTHNGTGAGSYTSTLTGLQPSTNYAVRSYARNSTGIIYGNTISFTTPSSGK